MSDLDNIKSEPKAKRNLKGVHFQFKGAHIAYTHGDQGGAASGYNEPVLLKASDINKKLTPSQQEILDEIGEEFTPLDKNLTVDTNTPSSTTVDLGEDNKNDKGNTELMSDNAEILKKLEQLEQDNKILKAEKVLAAYSFDGDVKAGIAGAIADLNEDQVSFITKAFDSLIADKEEAVNKAKEVVEKEEETELAKALKQEQGSDSINEEEAELTMAEKLIKARNELTNKDAK
jgi:hypothetical protein